ncbi:MAG: acyl carrier protein [Lachnospiraceae bacterium]|nr:acyl carrier protein [Lachnospiraceae bacterium]
MFEKVRLMIAEQLQIDENTITRESDFKEDLGADSLDLFELMMSFEDKYNIDSATDLTQIRTVGDLIDFLESRGIEE